MIAVDITFMRKNMKNGILSTGVANLCGELLDGFVQNGVSEDFVLVGTRQQKKDVEVRFPQYKFLEVPFYLPRNRLVFLDRISDLFYSFLLKKNCIHKVWFPFATPYTCRYLKVKSAFTVHDIIPVHENRDDRKVFNQFKKVIREADLVISDSEYVVGDITKTYPGVAKNIIAIHSPVSIDREEVELISDLKDVKYVIDVNAYQERKNPKTLIDAFFILKDKVDFSLVFCGGYKQNDVLERCKNYVKELGIADRVYFYYSISKKQRNWLMANALFAVSPTSSEGFGRTPVEAAILAKSVITTRVDSLPEITNERMHYYNNPQSADELADAIYNLYINPDDEAMLIQNAKYFVKEYSKEKIASLYYNKLKVL